MNSDFVFVFDLSLVLQYFLKLHLELKYFSVLVIYTRIVCNLPSHLLKPDFILILFDAEFEASDNFYYRTDSIMKRKRCWLLPSFILIYFRFWCLCAFVMRFASALTLYNNHWNGQILVEMGLLKSFTIHNTSSRGWSLYKWSDGC